MTAVTGVCANTTAQNSNLKVGAKIQDVYGNNELTLQFTKADKDKDGVLSQEEISALNKTITFNTDKGAEKIYPGMDVKDIKNIKFFADLDVDGDGKISEKELTVFTKHKNDLDKANKSTLQERKKGYWKAAINGFSGLAIGAGVAICLCCPIAAPIFSVGIAAMGCGGIGMLCSDTITDKIVK